MSVVGEGIAPGGAAHAVTPLATAPRACVVSPAPRADWEEVVRADPDALVTQTPAWSQSLCASTGARDASRLYDFGDGRRFVLPLVRPRLAPVAASFPPAWGFGGLVGAAPRPAEVGAVLRDLERLPLARVRIRPNPLHADAWAAGSPEGWTRIERRAHAIDLRDGWDEAWKRFSSRARNHVRRAERSGVEVETDATGRLLPVFYELFMRSVDRWAEKQHEPLALARWRAHRRDPVDKLAGVLRGCDGAGQLWVARVDGRPAAAILVLRGANAHYTRGAMDIELAGPARANYLLHRLAIEDACRAGCTTYHMGETGSSGSLAQFKEALGAEPHGYAEHVTERLPLTTADSALRTAVKRVLRFSDDD